MKVALVGKTRNVLMTVPPLRKGLRTPMKVFERLNLLVKAEAD
jgi:hypothetical protein